jgi:hypothetical protein
MLVLLFIQEEHTPEMVEAEGVVAVPMVGHMDIIQGEVQEATQVWEVTEVVETLLEILLLHVLDTTLLVQVVVEAEEALRVVTTLVVEEEA